MSNSKYEISVIIPLFNAESSIVDTLESIHCQTLGFNNIEVIVIDDCSSDNSYAVVHDWSANYENVFLFKTDKQSGSAGRPRNIGLDNATAPYIMFIDNDDSFMPNACEDLLKLIKETNYDFVQGTYYAIDSGGASRLIDKAKSHTGHCIFLPLVWDKIYRRDFIEKYHIRFSEGFLAEDDVFASMCLSLSDCYSAADIPVLRYNTASLSISNTVSNEFWRKNIYGSYIYSIEFAKKAGFIDKLDTIYRTNPQFALFITRIIDIDDLEQVKDLLVNWKPFFVHAFEHNYCSDTTEARIIISSSYYHNTEDYLKVITSLWRARRAHIDDIVSTPDGNIVLGCQLAADPFLKEVDKAFEKLGTDAIQMGQAPVLSAGFLNIDNMLCVVPPNGTLAVSKACYETIGRYDTSLGWAATTDYYYRLLYKGMSCAPAPWVKSPSFKMTPPDITELWLDGLLLDYKHGNASLRRNVVLTIAKSILKYSPAIGNYSRSILISKLPDFFSKAKVYKSEGSEAKSFNFLLHSTKRGCDVLPFWQAVPPLVSIVMRTHDRKSLLSKTLNAMRHVTYPNYEIIIIEDGQPTAEQMIRTDFSDLPIIYTATNNPVGRSAAANIGCSKASGKYINFLDDDDFFYPEHITSGVTLAESYHLDMVFLQGLSMSILKTGTDSYDYVIKDFNFMGFPRLDPFTMSYYCKTPNNGVLFRRDLLDFAVGMREDLDANEDWSLWLRMLTKAQYSVLHYATCCFCVPYSDNERNARMKNYQKYTGLQLYDDMLWYETTYEQLRQYYEGLYNDFEALKVSGQLNSSIEYDYMYWHIDDEYSLENDFQEWLDLLKSHKGGRFSSLQFNHFYLGSVVTMKRHGSIPPIKSLI